MTRLAYVLGTATLVLAASTVYLAHDLKLERARNAQVSALAISLPPIDGQTPTSPENPAIAPVDATHATAQESGRNPVGSSLWPDTAQDGALRQRLDQLADPVARAARVAEFKEVLLPLMSEMVTFVGLDSDETERLLEFYAESMVRGQQLSLECQLTPGCDIRALQAAERGPAMKEVEQILGEGKLQRFATFEELQRVRPFGTQLPADQRLSEAIMTELATALAEERRRNVGDESASVFNRRLYDRAAGILTTQQLAVFEQQQEKSFAREVE